MAQSIADRRDVDFVLYEQFQADTLCTAKPFESYDKKTIDMVIAEARNLAVVRCPCRLVTGAACGKSLEVCIQVNKAADYTLERGSGRSLEKDEAIEIYDEVINAASQMTADTCSIVKTIVESGNSEDIDKTLAVIKAANQTDLTDSIKSLTSGKTNVNDFLNSMSGNKLMVTVLANAGNDSTQSVLMNVSSTVACENADREFNLFTNIWLKNQVYMMGNWKSRGGSFRNGYRDTLQDARAMLCLETRQCRDLILEQAEIQGFDPH